jgi:pimeloyl-ACP methyl ester carboxylesterase
MTNSNATGISVQHLDRGEGRVAYDLRGPGSSSAPLVVCMAGQGDIRATYRYLAPALADAGYRVAVMELRGHGDSDTTFTRYDDEVAAGDLLALVESLGGPALLVGHSMGAAASVIAADRRPDLVTGLALVGPFVREPNINVVMRGLFRLAMQPLWARPLWKAWLGKLYAGRRPADHDAHVAAMMAALARPGHTRAFTTTTREADHEVAAEAIPRVHKPTLVVMGALDPDFPDPAAEAAWIAGHLAGETLLVPEAGHYPHSQRPDLVNPAVVGFAARVAPRA